jgi:hypothetical protein
MFDAYRQPHMARGGAQGEDNFHSLQSRGSSTVPVVGRPFAFFGGFSPGSFERICRIVSIMARIASGRVTGARCLAIQASSAFKWEGCRRTPTSVPLPVVTGRPRRSLVITRIDLAMIRDNTKLGRGKCPDRL